MLTTIISFRGHQWPWPNVFCTNQVGGTSADRCDAGCAIHLYSDPFHLGLDGADQCSTGL